MKKNIKLGLVILTLTSSSLFSLTDAFKVNNALEVELKKLSKRLSLTENYIFYSDELFSKKDKLKFQTQIDNIELEVSKHEDKLKIMENALNSPQIKKLLSNVDNKKIDKKTKDINMLKEKSKVIFKNRNKIVFNEKSISNNTNKLKQLNEIVTKKTNKVLKTLDTRVKSIISKEKHLETLLDTLLLNTGNLKSGTSVKSSNSVNTNLLLVEIANLHKIIKEMKSTKQDNNSLDTKYSKLEKKLDSSLKENNKLKSDLKILEKIIAKIQNQLKSNSRKSLLDRNKVYLNMKKRRESGK